MGRDFYKKIYRPRDFYKALVLTIRSAAYLRSNRKNKLISSQFRERIMLAVSEVNGCAACSYAHTRIALEEGMSTEEIDALLNGDTKSSPADELIALFFAQHYTENKGCSSKESWLRLVDEYGQEKALVILAFIRMINTGNIYGLAAGAMVDRFKGKASGKTSFLDEISILLSVLIYLPLATVHAVIDKIKKKSIYPYKD